VQDSVAITVGLPIALAVVMFGLGMSLTTGDFRRVARTPRAVALALSLQVLVLPVLAFGLVAVADLDPLLAVGVLLLASSPGGTTANLFSHLFGGDVALNVTLTAINSVLAAFTIPLVTNFAIDHYGADGELGLQYAKVLQVIAIVLVPVAIGMLVRRRWNDVAVRADRPVRVFSICLLALVCAVAIFAERENIADYVRQIGLLTAVFCLISLSLGYAGARLVRLTDAQSVACAMEVGVHNTTISLTIALSVLDSSEVAVPSAVYGLSMYPIAAAFGYVITRTRRVAPEAPVEVPRG
jgi:BASS family bile acid:Na+ symporter